MTIPIRPGCPGPSPKTTNDYRYRALSPSRTLDADEGLREPGESNEPLISLSSIQLRLYGTLNQEPDTGPVLILQGLILARYLPGIASFEAVGWSEVLTPSSKSDDFWGTKSNDRCMQITFVAKRCLHPVTHVGVFSLSLVPLRAVQCDQTTIWGTPRITCREEVGQSLQRRVRFLLRVRLQHGNYLDCFIGSISARRWGLGLFAMAALTRLPNKHLQMRHDPICGIAEGRSAPNSIR